MTATMLDHVFVYGTLRRGGRNGIGVLAFASARPYGIVRPMPEWGPEHRRLYERVLG